MDTIKICKPITSIETKIIYTSLKFLKSILISLISNYMITEKIFGKYAFKNALLIDLIVRAKSRGVRPKLVCFFRPREKKEDEGNFCDQGVYTACRLYTHFLYQTYL